MNKPFAHRVVAPFTDELPAPLYFRAAQMQALTTYPWHRHPWGEFVYSFSGVMEIKLADEHFIVPPQFGLWLPPEAEHLALNRQEAYHSSLYIAQPLCEHLPDTACALTITPLIRALLDDLRASPPAPVQTEEDSRLLYVLLDKLTQTSRVGSYLPGSNDPVLSPILEAWNRTRQTPAPWPTGRAWSTPPSARCCGAASVTWGCR